MWSYFFNVVIISNDTNFSWNHIRLVQRKPCTGSSKQCIMFLRILIFDSLYTSIVHASYQWFVIINEKDLICKKNQCLYSFSNFIALSFTFDGRLGSLYVDKTDSCQKYIWEILDLLIYITFNNAAFFMFLSI